MDANKTTKEFNFGQYWQVYGTQSIMVPAHFTIEDAIEHVKAIWKNIGLATDPAYVLDSDVPDFENCDFGDWEDDNA